MKKLRAIAVFATAIVLVETSLAQAVKVNREDLPQPVLNTVEKLAPGSASGGGLKQTDKDGTVKYVVNSKQGDKRVHLVITADGQLYERSETAQFSDLPDPVKKKIDYVCSGQPDMLTKITHAGGQPVYQFSIGRVMEEDGSKRVRQDNLGSMSQVTREDVPGPVLSALGKLDSGTDWMAVKLGGDNAKYGPGYMIRTKSKKFFVFSPDGQLHETWDMTVKGADLPESIRKMDERASGAGEETLIKVTAAGKKPYYRFSLKGSVAEDGNLIMEKED
jgi:hypothetical protein